jgi:hypothetical protein
MWKVRFLPALALLSLLASAGSAGADEGTKLPPIDHAATLSECAACHMAYPPQMLPARSWQKIIDNLADHFGEDASLAEPVRTDILAYLTAHAADAPGTAQGPRFLRGLGADATPLRITRRSSRRRIASPAIAPRPRASSSSPRTRPQPFAPFRFARFLGRECGGRCSTLF